MRALVVDDEKTPRELLSQLVPWSKYGFVRVDTARNGLEALEVLGQGGVDLVLTDVRMPKMDGIALALEVRKRWPDCVLLFLSGFSDKEYLKTAIRVQAQDYLEKPIDLAAVEAAVAEAARGLQLRKRNQEDSEKEERERKDLGPLRRQAQVQSLLGLIPPVELEDRFAQGPLRALVLVPGPGAAASWPVATANRINSGEHPAFAAAQGTGREVLLVADRTLASGADFDTAVARLLDDFGSSPPGTRLAVSMPTAPPGLPAALEEAREALREAFYRPTQALFVARPPSGRILELTDEQLRAWTAALEANELPTVLRQFELLEQRAATVRDPDHDRVRAAWRKALEALLAYVPAWGGPERSARLEKLSQDLVAAPDLPTLAAVAKDCFERLFVRSPAELHAGDRVQKAVVFIESRFADPDLTVDDIAGHVGFSESYFCTVFKQAQGTTVKDFVTRTRIDRAKAYLWEKEPPSLADLALKVGFRDPNYFSTVFKRLTGTSPGAYRKKALG